MRSFLILATLALVCFVDKNSAAAVRRDDDSSVYNAISPLGAQTDVGVVYPAASAADAASVIDAASAIDGAPATGVQTSVDAVYSPTATLDTKSTDYLNGAADAVSATD
ncbi:hypothetical protein G6F33_004634 [Rhizopus arrhizus]|nr:hypothetical protein G6F24_007538 [Rhizopus arrhizus]KAG0914014.1 hypothetical protein G6F33_004634 [Rhizopus arrhizus]KAG0944453.1 hypothetical protein G6F32_007340 [Rhizopus arrhizus]